MVAAFQSVYDWINVQDEANADIVENIGDDCHVDIPEVMDGDWRLDASFEESQDVDIDMEIREFNQEEEQVSIALRSLERLSCFAHSLQCAVRNLDKSRFACSSRRVAFKLIQSFSHSTTATQLLVEKTKKKLLTACPTRWSYTRLALLRLIELKPAIDEITQTVTTIDNLSNSQWSSIQHYVEFTKPFADATYSLVGNRYTTLSEVIPELYNLNCHLDDKVSLLYAITNV